MCEIAYDCKKFSWRTTNEPQRLEKHFAVVLSFFSSFFSFSTIIPFLSSLPPSPSSSSSSSSIPSIQPLHLKSFSSSCLTHSHILVMFHILIFLFPLIFFSPFSFAQFSCLPLLDIYSFSSPHFFSFPIYLATTSSLPYALL